MISKINSNGLLQDHYMENVWEFKGQCIHLTLPVYHPDEANFKINKVGEICISYTCPSSHSTTTYKEWNLCPFSMNRQIVHKKWSYYICCSKITYNKNVIDMSPCPLEEKLYLKLHVSPMHIQPFYCPCYLKNFYSYIWINFKIHIHLIKLLPQPIEEQNNCYYKMPIPHIMLSC